MNDNRKGSFWDLSKRPLNTEESYFIASNLKRIEKSKERQIKFDADFSDLFKAAPLITTIILIAIICLPLLIEYFD